MHAIKLKFPKFTFIVIPVFLVLLVCTLKADTLLLEQNIYIANPKPVRNEVDPKDLEREKRERESRRIGRRLTHFFNGETGDPFSYFHPTKQRLFANRYWPVEIQPEAHGSKTEIEVSVNQGESFSYRKPILLPIPNLNEIRYRAIDQLQNEEKWKSIFISRDDVGPKLNYGFDGPYLVLDQTVYGTKETKVKVYSEDEESGVLHQFVKIGDGDWSIIENDVVSFQELQGRQQVTLASLDQLYNRSNLIRFATVMVSEIKAPSLETEFVVLSETGAICNRKSSVWFPKWEHPVPYHVYWRKKDNGDFSKYVKGQILLEDANEGEEYQLEFLAKDELGNQSKPEIWKCKFDSKPPTTTIQKVEEGDSK
ncbi:hypothetical protein [Leptospira levettii]|uniref:hypothetical protein n=1 Tax=Leptospira levettii TaxID=2023178 RepID=UPI003EC03891